ncbi:hypothetical protein [Mesorhizobium sp.]|uniref:hypothetical protein n=1 Tax=Mesorhizobium sp. TaxID=1871066 RepID=UPI000FE79699|nr:hypothetical protein [Mesorhizobium sp.]RWP13899.1 MAG: hypothetical protein EOQ97_02915 [Mesorhizobium sp.]
MRASQAGGGAEIPVLPLVDILFSAFAAILGTSIVVAAMIRTRVPEDEHPALPHFTMFVQTTDAKTCPLTKLDASFGVAKEGQQEKLYTLASQFSKKPVGAGVDAWYFRSEGVVGCVDCLRVELAILNASKGLVHVRPEIRHPQSGCEGSLKYSMELGMPPTPGPFDPLPVSSDAKNAAIRTIEVTE